MELRLSRCERLLATENGSSSRRILLQELDGIADGQDGLRGIVRNLAAEFLLERHDELDRVQAVGSKVVDEARAVGHLVGFDSEMLHHDLLNALRDIAHFSLFTCPSSGLARPPSLA